LQEAHARQTLELQRVRADLDKLLDASIEMSVQAEAGRSSELASRAKSEFLATISHEIRTPLHGILGNAELLLGTRLDEDQKRCVRLLRSSAQALTDILNDVLDYSKIEAGRLELTTEPFDLGACVFHTRSERDERDVLCLPIRAVVANEFYFRRLEPVWHLINRLSTRARNHKFLVVFL
jgi:signal transduction histidine kinase